MAYDRLHVASVASSMVHQVVSLVVSVAEVLYSRGSAAVTSASAASHACALLLVVLVHRATDTLA
jgi:hypothetical protein